ncbi:hypothetical protein BpHYR1_007435 [Brachionus plicatilis]|uniref:Uncharacterized protein n=1 Tax=Brachionus plicatilis TaxID=10195 RepID=A0A3M7PYA6_BRAPC|nr:hypothetical protein BpHYR1_007435 [Brachionus plicatilis]
MSNFEDIKTKFQTISIKIDKIDEFELVWFIIEVYDPRDSFMKPTINGKEYYQNLKVRNMITMEKKNLGVRNQLKKT